MKSRLCILGSVTQMVFIMAGSILVLENIFLFITILDEKEKEANKKWRKENIII